MKKITTLCLSLMIALTGMADEWTLVTSSNPLQDGDQIIIAYAAKNYVASQSVKTSSSANYLEAIEATFDGNTLTNPGEKVGIFIVEKSGTSWKLSATATDGSTVYLGATAAKKLSYASTATNTWNISIDGSGDATITSTNSNYGTLYFNNGTPRFCNYTSTNNMKAVQLYRGSSTPSVSISYQGFPYRKTACEEPTYEAGSTYTLPTFVPVNEEGKSLKEWSYGDATYAPGATFTVPESDVVFVPVWNGATAIDNAAEAVRATKILRNGQLIIVRGDAEYNAIGTRVK